MASIADCYIAELCDMFESLILGLSGIESTPGRLKALLVDRDADSGKPGMTVDEFTRLRESIMK